MPKPDPNDISNFRKPTRVGVLATSEAEPKQPKAVKSSVAPKPATKAATVPKVAKPKKPRRSRKLTLYLTDQEMAQLERDADLVPLAKFLVSKMQKAGILLEEK